MKIADIHIDGFGVWNDRSWEGLSGGVNVFCGPNEAGKTTLMSFIRSVLFGFERRNHPHRYEPLAGGNHGGYLRATYQGCPVRIERRAGRHVRGEVIVSGGAAGDGGESELDRMLGGTTRTLYHNVFAFGLSELEEFRTLKENEIASHISGAGMGVGATRWSAVWKDLDDRQRSLFLPRGQKTINRALDELREVRLQLTQTESEPEEYVRAREARERLLVELRDVEAFVERLRKQVAHYERLRQAAPHRAHRVALEAELSGLERVERFPDGGVVRLNLLFDQRRQLESDLENRRSQSRQLRNERADLAVRYTPQELLRRDRILEGMRTLLPRLEAADERLAQTRTSHKVVEAEEAAVVTRRREASPPSPPATLVFSSFVAVVGATLLLSGNEAGAGVVGFLLMLIGIWYFRRHRRVAAIDSELRQVRRRLPDSLNDGDRAQADCDKIRSLLEGLCGRRMLTPGDLDREADRVRELTRMADRIRAIDGILIGEDRQRERTEQRIAEAERAIHSLLAEGGAVSESEFFRRAEVFAQRKKVMAELDRTPAGEVPTDDPDLAGIDRMDPDGYRQIQREFDESRERLKAAQSELGALEERIATLSKSEERSRARAREASLSARLEEASEKWAVLTLCRTLLDDTRKVYETERQPTVLKHASEFLSLMSQGSWVRVVSPLDSDELIVESPGGVRVPPENLSRGTAEQLYLAMRLALVREYSDHVEPLPIIFDDIFVNFDPGRARRAIESVGDLARTHQVLIFTCHPHLVELAREVIPGLQVYPLQ